LSAQLVAAGSGDVLVPVRETAKDSTKIIDAVDRLSKHMRERIGESLRSIRQAPPLHQVTTASLPALRKYSQAARAEDAGEVARSASLFQEAIALDSSFAGAHRALSIMLNNYGLDRALAARSMSKAYQLRNRLPEREQLWTIGSYHIARNEFREALVPFLTLLEMEPDESRLINNIGVAYHEMREESRSLEFYERARDLNPRSPVAHFNVVVTNVDLGRIDGAKAENERFQEALPGHPTYHINRIIIGLAEFDHGAVESAIEDVAAYEDASTAANLMWLRLMLAGIRGQSGTAEEVLRLGEARAARGLQVPEYLSAVTTIGMYDAAVRGDPVGAVARVERALDAFPLDDLEPLDRPYLELAVFYARAGNAVRGRSYLEAFDREVPEEYRPAVAVEYDRSVAQVTLAEGRLEEAIETFRRADRRSCRICVLPGLARAYDQQGNLDSLQAVLERYVETPEDDRWEMDPLELPGVYRRLAQVYEARGNIDGAIDYYGRFADLWADADPELQPLVTEARESIQRLIQERR
jgi:tetratricopeptide (TPR) repeat protein